MDIQRGKKPALYHTKNHKSIEKKVIKIYEQINFRSILKIPSSRWDRLNIPLPMAKNDWRRYFQSNNLMLFSVILFDFIVQNRYQSLC